MDPPFLVTSVHPTRRRNGTIRVRGTSEARIVIDINPHWGRKIYTMSGMLILAIALQGLGGADASAQGFDGHGSTPPPDGPHVADPILGYGGAITGPPTFTVWTATATSPLVERITDGKKVTDVPVIDDLFGFEFGFASNIDGRLGAGVSLPVWFASDGQIGTGPAIGDITLWAPVRLVHTQRQRLGAVPFILLPTGPEARFLGESGFGAGALVSGAADAGPLLGSLDAGLDSVAASGYEEWPGGLHARYAADIGFMPTGSLGLHFEVRSRFPLSSAAPTLPTEAMGSVKIRPSDRLFLTGAFGTAVTRGVGAAGSRMFLGLTSVPGKEALPADGPPAIAYADIHVIDRRMFPINAAIITVGGLTVETDHEGYALIPSRALKRTGVIHIEREGFEPVALTVDADKEWWEVQLIRKPVSVAVSVVGPEGVLLSLDVDIQGPYDAGEPQIDEAGVFNWLLRAGTWRVTMSSPGLGSQERTIIIEESRSDAIRVDAVLAPLLSDVTSVRVQVVDRRGRPVEDAVVALEDRDLGTTGTGGDIKIAGLKEGSATFVVRSERFGDDTVVDLVIEEGETAVFAVLDWLAGAVMVVVSDSIGLPINAKIDFNGPVSLPNRTLGDDGEELFVLRPGSWELVITAPGMGTQRRRIDVMDEAGELVEVNVMLLAEEDGNATLEVRIVDPSGAALSGVDVTLAGKRVGQTGGTGTVTLEGLHPGIRDIAVDGDQLVTVTV
jgi:hypothetical protein